MPAITFNAFSFLRKKLNKHNIECTNAEIEVEADTTPLDLIANVHLTPEEVEVVLINGKVAPLDTRIQENDRVALLPPGTPGPYRVLLGFKNKAKQ